MSTPEQLCDASHIKALVGSLESTSPEQAGEIAQALAASLAADGTSVVAQAKATQAKGRKPASKENVKPTSQQTKTATSHLLASLVPALIKLVGACIDRLEAQPYLAKIAQVALTYLCSGEAQCHALAIVTRVDLAKLNWGTARAFGRANEPAAALSAVKRMLSCLCNADVHAGPEHAGWPVQAPLPSQAADAGPSAKSLCTLVLAGLETWVACACDLALVEPLATLAATDLVASCWAPWLDALGGVAPSSVEPHRLAAARNLARAAACLPAPGDQFQLGLCAIRLGAANLAPPATDERVALILSCAASTAACATSHAALGQLAQALDVLRPMPRAHWATAASLAAKLAPAGADLFERWTMANPAADPLAAGYSIVCALAQPTSLEQLNSNGALEALVGTVEAFRALASKPLARELPLVHAVLLRVARALDGARRRTGARPWPAALLDALAAVLALGERMEARLPTPPGPAAACFARLMNLRLDVALAAAHATAEAALALGGGERTKSGLASAFERLASAAALSNATKPKSDECTWLAAAYAQLGSACNRAGCAALAADAFAQAHRLGAESGGDAPAHGQAAQIALAAVVSALRAGRPQQARALAGEAMARALLARTHAMDTASLVPAVQRAWLDAIAACDREGTAESSAALIVGECLPAWLMSSVQAASPEAASQAWGLCEAFWHAAASDERVFSRQAALAFRCSLARALDAALESLQPSEANAAALAVQVRARIEHAKAKAACGAGDDVVTLLESAAQRASSAIAALGPSSIHEGALACELAAAQTWLAVMVVAGPSPSNAPPAQAVPASDNKRRKVPKASATAAAPAPPLSSPPSPLPAIERAIASWRSACASGANVGEASARLVLFADLLELLDAPAQSLALLQVACALSQAGGDDDALKGIEARARLGRAFDLAGEFALARDAFALVHAHDAESAGVGAGSSSVRVPPLLFECEYAERREGPDAEAALEAAGRLSELAESAEAEDSAMVAAMAHAALASLAWHAGETARALAADARALDWQRRAGAGPPVGSTLLAASVWPLADSTDVQYVQSVLSTLHRLGRTHAACGDARRADAYLRKGAALADALGVGALRLRFALALAELAADRGQRDLAATWLAQADAIQALLPAERVPLAHFSLRYRTGVLHAALGDAPASLVAYDQARQALLACTSRSEHSASSDDNFDEMAHVRTRLNLRTAEALLACRRAEEAAAVLTPGDPTSCEPHDRPWLMLLRAQAQVQLCGLDKRLEAAWMCLPVPGAAPVAVPVASAPAKGKARRSAKSTGAADAADAAGAAGPITVESVLVDLKQAFRLACAMHTAPLIQRIARTCAFMLPDDPLLCAYFAAHATGRAYQLDACTARAGVAADYVSFSFEQFCQQVRPALCALPTSALDGPHAVVAVLLSDDCERLLLVRDGDRAVDVPPTTLVVGLPAADGETGTSTGAWQVRRACALEGALAYQTIDVAALSAVEPLSSAALDAAAAQPLCAAKLLRRFGALMLESRRTLAVGAAASGRAEKEAWWRARIACDEALGELLDAVQRDWLGPLALLLLPTPSLAAVLSKAQVDAFSGAAASAGLIEPSAAKRSPVWGAVQALLPVWSRVSAEQRETVEAFLVSGGMDGAAVSALLSAHAGGGRAGASATAFGGARSRKGAASRATDGGESAPLGSTVLLLDSLLAHFPVEALPIIRDAAVTRVPSLECLCELLTASGACVDTRRGAFLLNAAGDLAATQAQFEPVLRSLPGWRGWAGEAPESSELARALGESAVFVYCGHSGGEAYLGSDAVRALPRAPVALLFGCSSGLLRAQGGYDPTGLGLAYLAARSPLVLANLWDVTDKDLDRLAGAFTDDWLALEHARATGRSAAHVLPDARRTCKLPLLVGAACVCFGVSLRPVPQ